MAKVWLVGVNGPEWRALKVIRDTMRVCAPSTSAADASRVLDKLKKEGAALLGDSATDGLQDMINKLHSADFNWFVGSDPFTNGLAKAPAPLAAVERTDTQEVCDATVLFLVQAAGDPLNAAALAAGMFRVTGDDLYVKMVDYLAYMFPFLKGRMEIPK